MDYFERAHVVKINETKPKKEQAATKKQLKIMLRGYKASDIELIKEAENVNVDLDESSSVSGFSDLNLTSSGDDEVYYKNIQKCKSDGVSVSKSHQNILTTNLKDIKRRSTSSVNTTTDGSLDDTVTSASLAYTDEIMTTSYSISANDEDNSSLTNISLVGTNSCSLSDRSTNSIDSFSESNLSEFDSNGELAFQIHEKLKSHKQAKSNQTKHEKKKIVDSEVSPEKKKKPNKEEYLREKILVKGFNVSDDVDLSTEKVVNSSSFISITATDLQEESFNNVLGDYKHSTVRNLPVDSQTSFTTDTAFPVECFSADVNTRNIDVDEVSSLIPEIDNDLSVADLVETDINCVTTSDAGFEETTMTDSIDTCSLLDKFNNCKQNNDNDKYKIYYGNKNCVVVLKHPAEIYIHGKVIVKALGGLVEVFGHKLTNTECPIIAPFYTYAQCLKTVQNNNNYKSVYSKIKETGITYQETEEIVVNVGKHDGIILLKPMECPKMEFVASNFLTANLFKSNYYNENELDKAGALLGCTLYSTRPQKFFQENPLWERVLPCNDSPTIGIACGGKGSGKTTFMRYYVNRLLQQSPVLVIDLDPGQSEFTVAGNVSATVVEQPIFGPSFTHLKKPNMCLNIGIISTMDNIPRYVNAIKNIISYCRNTFGKIPWIINTMGMTNAVGLKLMALIISLAQPDFVLQYDSRNAKKCFNVRLTPSNVTDLLRKYKYDKIFSNVPINILEYSLIMAPEADMFVAKKSSLLPRDERNLSFLAYFAGLADLGQEKSWLLGVVPYEVSLKDLNVAVNVRLKDDCITKVINGKVVALCQQMAQCHQTRVFTLADKPLLCHGHGLIRGVDWRREVIYVITPLAGDELRLVNTLVYADWVPELPGQEAHLPEGTTIPYRTSAQQQKSKLMAVPKRRFNPLQLLKMTRNS